MKNNLLSEKLIYTGESQTPTHLHLCTYNANEMQEVSGADFHEISSSLNSERINWLQVHGMKNTETVREICEHFEINFLVLQDILNANHPTKIEEHDNYIVLILKLFYPAPKKTRKIWMNWSNNKYVLFWVPITYLLSLKKKLIFLMM